MPRDKYIEIAYREIVTRDGFAEELWEELLSKYQNDISVAEFHYVQERSSQLESEKKTSTEKAKKKNKENNVGSSKTCDDEIWELTESELELYTQEELGDYYNELEEQKDWIKGMSGNDILDLAIKSNCFDEMRYLLFFLRYRKTLDLSKLHELADTSIRICMKHKKL